MQLEMPSWMVEAHASAKTFSSKELSWMKLFQSGDGFRVHLQANISTWVPDTFSWIRHLPDSGFQVTSNSEGFRIPRQNSSLSNTPSILPLPNRTKKRIVFFGDSSTFGWGVDAEDSYPQLLKTELSGLDPETDFEIVNFAMPGDSSEFGRLIFDKFASKSHADLIVLSFGANDARLSSVPHRSQVTRFQEQALLQTLRTSLARESAFFRLFENALKPAQTTPPSDETLQSRDEAVPIGRYKKNLRYMVEQSRLLGAEKIALVSICSPANYARAMKHIAEKKDALFYNGQYHLRKSIPALKKGKKYPSLVHDMEQRFPKLLHQQSLLYVSSDGCHPNKIGNRIIAKKLARVLQR
jgi:lysophospholipase L1-like esterase